MGLCNDNGETFSRWYPIMANNAEAMQMVHQSLKHTLLAVKRPCIEQLDLIADLCTTDSHND
jgi:hypothetical protein